MQDSFCSIGAHCKIPGTNTKFTTKSLVGQKIKRNIDIKAWSSEKDDTMSDF